MGRIRRGRWERLRASTAPALARARCAAERAGNALALAAGAAAARGAGAARGAAASLRARRRGRPRLSRTAQVLLLGGGAWAAARLLRARRDARLPSWRGRVALVTGGSRGLGLLLARELAAEGARLAICARDEDELRRAAEDLSARGAEVLALRCDVTDDLQVRAMVADVLAILGRIDVLVNNAGTIRVGPIDSTSRRDFDEALDVLVGGPVSCTLAVLPHMLARGSGHVVNVSSFGGRIGVPHLAPYAAGKFALSGFTEALRAEVAHRGIAVTGVFPGTMRTGSHRRALFQGRRRAEYRWFALGGTLPFLSMSAERAARKIVRAAKRGEAELVMPLWARLAVPVHALAPATVSRLAGLVDRVVLPRPTSDGREPQEGARVEERLAPGPRRRLRALTTLGRAAGRRANQTPPAAPPPPPPPNVGRGERLVSLGLGAVLVARGLAARSPAAAAGGLLGLALAARGLGGRCPVYRRLGVDTAADEARTLRATYERTRTTIG